MELKFKDGKSIEVNTLGELIDAVHDNTMLCIASGLTCQNEFIKTQSVEEWKNFNAETIQKVPAIFLLFKEMIKC